MNNGCTYEDIAAADGTPTKKSSTDDSEIERDTLNARARTSTSSMMEARSALLVLLADGFKVYVYSEIFGFADTGPCK